MPYDSDQEIDEMMEEMAEDLGRTREQAVNNQQPEGLTRTYSGLPFLLGGVGLIILIAILFAFLFKGEGVSEGDLESITDGLDRIEKRLGRLEEIETKTEAFEKQIKELQASILELKSFKASSEKELGDISKKIEQNPEKKTTAINQKKESRTLSSDPSAKSGQYHIVKKGETLYRISQRYGIKVDELRRMNNLKPNDEIFPEQRLLVKP